MVTVRMAFVANVFVRMITFEKAGDRLQGHAHNHDHSSLLSSGSLKAIVNGQETIFKAPAILFIAKEYRHEFQALEDNTVLSCIHAVRHDDGSGDLVDPESIPHGVNSRMNPNDAMPLKIEAFVNRDDVLANPSTETGHVLSDIQVTRFG